MSKLKYSSKSLSFIIPVYNEEKRLQKLIKEILKFKKKHNNLRFEFIIVNDGSKDNTNTILKRYFYKQNYIKIVNLKKNFGKGYALKKGVSIAKNELIITIDADLSVKFDQILFWQNKYKIDSNKSVYFGSRKHKLSRIKTTFNREFLGIFLSIIIYILIDKKLRDTQCGFKLYPKKLGKIIFRKLNIQGFAHDIEIVLILKKMKVKILELPVSWTHKIGSKVNLFTEPVNFILIIIYLKFKYLV